MPATTLKYIAIMGAVSLWAPLFWIPAVMRYSNILQGALFLNNDYFVHYAVYPMLACWISVFPLSLATILLFNLIKWNFLWSVIPVTAGTIVLIFVVGFLSSWGGLPPRSFSYWISAMMLYLSLPAVIVWVNYFMVHISRGRKKYT